MRDALQHIQGPQDVVISNTKATPKEKNVKTTKVVKTSTITNTSNSDNKEETTKEEVRRPNPRVDGAPTVNNGQPMYNRVAIGNKQVSCNR